MNLTGTSENPIPSGADSGYFTTEDGVKLRYARWKPVNSSNKGTVCLFSGRGEFIEKQFETVADLRRRGFHVAVLDWRGQGLSDRLLKDRRRGHIRSYSQYEQDVKAFLSEIVLPDCPPPFFALAHSMGALALLHYTAAARPIWFQRLVLISPMVRLTGKSLPMPLIRLLAKLACRIGLSGMRIPGKNATPAEDQPFDDNEVTSDKKRFERFKGILHAAPELSAGIPTLGWLKASLKAMAALRHDDFMQRIDAPVLMIAAGRDKVVSRRAIEHLGKRLPLGGTVTIDGAQHDLLYEQDIYRDQFWAAFDAFIPGSDRE